MARWGVLVVDDEPAARRGVRQLLAHFPEFAVIGECRDGREALASLASLAPDVVFLDVQMPGMDGFEIIRRRTPDQMPAVVFLTAFDQFAIQAFEAQATDYLVKPVSQARFTATMKRLARQLEARPAPREPRLVVPTAHGAAVLSLSEIDWIEAEDNYARVWSGGRSYLLREPLSQIEKQVSRHGYIRAHRGALVPIARVKELRTTDEGQLIAILAGDVRIPVSRRRRGEFAAAVKST